MIASSSTLRYSLNLKGSCGISEMLDVNEGNLSSFIREVELGIEAADEGRLNKHADVKAKWEAKRAATME
jgi:hypothetical protein